MCLVDKNAMACYDCMICPITSIACQRLGMPASAEQLHDDVLLHTKYHIKTAHGISDNFYSSNDTQLHQGQGQGSGNAPSCWNATSTPMWTTLSELSPSEFCTFNPSFTNQTSTQGISFVDDTTNLLNCPLTSPVPTNQTMIADLAQLAQTWERLLHTTGGALKPEKCFCYAMLWNYDGVVPTLKTLSQLPSQAVHITDSNNNQNKPIQFKDIDHAKHTLGVRLCPSSANTAEFIWLKQKANNLSHLLHRSNLNCC